MVPEIWGVTKVGTPTSERKHNKTQPDPKEKPLFMSGKKNTYFESNPRDEELQNPLFCSTRLHRFSGGSQPGFRGGAVIKTRTRDIP